MFASFAAHHVAFVAECFFVTKFAAHVVAARRGPSRACCSHRDGQREGQVGLFEPAIGDTTATAGRLLPAVETRIEPVEGVPEGGRDFAFGDAFPHEALMDQLGGVDFRKGCYVGQELTARTKYRGLVRKRLMPVEIEGPLPAFGTEIVLDGPTKVLRRYNDTAHLQDRTAE